VYNWVASRKKNNAIEANTPAQVEGRSVEKDIAVIEFRDHIRVDETTVNSALLQLNHSPTSRIEIRWHDKINDVQSLIKSMLSDFDKKITYLPNRDITHVKVSFYKLVDNVNRVQEELISSLDRVLELTEGVEQAYRQEAVFSFCAFGALRLVSFLQKFANKLLDENDNVIYRVFNDLPRDFQGNWFRCVPYISMTGLLAFGVPKFLICRVGVSDTNYQYLFLPEDIATHYQDAVGYPLDVYYKWVLPQWLLRIDEKPPPPLDEWCIMMLRDEFGREKSSRHRQAPWNSEHTMRDMEDESERDLPDGDELSSGFVVKRGAIRTVLVRRQDTEAVSAEEHRQLGVMSGEESRIQPPIRKYDVTLSFAGEDRAYAQELADLLEQAGYCVFYDKYEQARLWGKNLYTHLSDVYSNKADYCVMFISQHYAKKVWTNHEREAAQARALLEKEEYILPLRLDDSRIPGLLETVHHLDLRAMTIRDVFKLLVQKLQERKPINLIGRGDRSPKSPETWVTVTGVV
jgi:hypothetical protein